LSTPNTYFPKRLITGIITAAILSLLVWQQFHGGVPEHHLLQKKELPAISNWWGALLLPVLTWILLGRIEKRLQKKGATTPLSGKYQIRIIGLSLLGLALGLSIAISFTFDYKPYMDNVLYVLLVLSVLVPIFYAEFMLGFVLGMSYTFGVVLPTAFIMVLAATGFVIFLFFKALIWKSLFKSKYQNTNTNFENT